MKTFRKLVFLLCIYGQFKSFTASSNSSESAETEDSENTFILKGNRQYHFLKTKTSFLGLLTACYQLDANIWTIRKSDNLPWLFSNIEEESPQIWFPYLLTPNKKNFITPEYTYPRLGFFSDGHPGLHPSNCLVIKQINNTFAYAETNCDAQNSVVCTKELGPDNYLAPLKDNITNLEENIVTITELKKIIKRQNQKIQDHYKTYHTWRTYVFQALTLAFGLLSIVSVVTACKSKKVIKVPEEISKESPPPPQQNQRYMPSAPYHPAEPEQIPLMEVHEVPGPSKRFVASIKLHEGVTTKIQIPCKSVKNTL